MSITHQINQLAGHEVADSAASESTLTGSRETLSTAVEDVVPAGPEDATDVGDEEPFIGPEEVTAEHVEAACIDAWDKFRLLGSLGGRAAQTRETATWAVNQPGDRRTPLSQAVAYLILGHWHKFTSIMAYALCESLEADIDTPAGYKRYLVDTAIHVIQHYNFGFYVEGLVAQRSGANIGEDAGPRQEGDGQTESADEEEDESVGDGEDEDEGAAEQLHTGVEADAEQQDMM